MQNNSILNRISLHADSIRIKYNIFRLANGNLKSYEEHDQL